MIGQGNWLANGSIIGAAQVRVLVAPVPLGPSCKATSWEAWGKRDRILDRELDAKL
jgi:hypothetical protein